MIVNRMININGIVAGYNLKESIKSPFKSDKIERCNPQPGQSIPK